MKIKQKIILKLNNKFGNKKWYQLLKTNYFFRVLVFSAFGTIATIAFATYNGILGIIYSSIWYGVFSAYLMVLAIQRILVILIYRLVHKKHYENKEELEKEKLKIYFANGIIFAPIAIAMAIIISLLISSQKPIVRDEILAITTATYTFYKITMAIINFVKAKSERDPIIQTVRNTCLIDAVLSIILLESTLITTFGKLTHELYIVVAVSGLVGCGMSLALGIYMIIEGAKKLKRKQNSPDFIS